MFFNTFCWQEDYIENMSSTILSYPNTWTHTLPPPKIQDYINLLEKKTSLSLIKSWANGYNLKSTITLNNTPEPYTNTATTLGAT